MSNPATPRKSIRFCGQSYLAFVLTPEPPIFEWLANFDEWSSQFAEYFADKPIVLDVSAVKLSNAAIVHLVNELRTRNIRIRGLHRATPNLLTRNRHRCCWKARCARASQLFSQTATLRCSARSPQAPKSLPAARSTFMVLFEAAPSRVWQETAVRAFSATKSKPSCSPSTAITESLTKSNRACAANPYRLGCKATSCL